MLRDGDRAWKGKALLRCYVAVVVTGLNVKALEELNTQTMSGMAEHK